MASTPKIPRGKCDTQFWTKAKTTKLIELFESNSDLWNITRKLYCDRTHKRKLLSEIADKLQTDASEVSAKLHNLRCQYNGALRKIKEKKSGSDSNEVYAPRWEFFNTLKFLSNVNRPCNNFSNRKVVANRSSAEIDFRQSPLREITSNTCRTCAQTIDNENYMNLFKEHNNDVVEKIQMVTGLMLKEEHCIPTVVCQCCLRDLELAMAFRERCINTEKLWLERQQLPTINKDVKNKHKQSINEKIEFDSMKNAMETFTGVESDNNFEYIDNDYDAKVEFRDQAKKTSKSKKQGKFSRSAESQLSVCDKCGKTFANRSNLREHLIRHSGVKKYQCTVCPYKIHSSNLLKRHLLKHGGERPYVCKYCDRTFRYSSNRLDHEKSHTNERPFQCRYCDKRFYTFSLHSDHELVHTGQRNFHCEVCDQWFLRRTSLVTHYRSKAHKLREQQKAEEKNANDKVS